MFPPLITKDPAAVEGEVQGVYEAIFPDGERLFVPRVFGWAGECFTGRFKDYQAVDAAYHDFEHTLQGTLCMTRLLRGRHRAGARPVVTRRLFELGLLAVLLHDTGYLKRRGDTQGTGAKYTATHVERSAALAAELLGARGFSAGDIEAVHNMIYCTGVDAGLKGIPFHDEAERTVGYALGTADLLGQMAADDYVEKLPVLYLEFAEAAGDPGGAQGRAGMFANPEDLMKRTPAFWEQVVRRKLEDDFGGLYRFLNDPYPDGPNEYVQRIEANMARLRQRTAGAGAARPR